MGEKKETKAVENQLEPLSKLFAPGTMLRKVLPELLIDHTTEKNIVWATDTYQEYGSYYSAERQMFPDFNLNLIEKDILCPRVLKSKEKQKERKRERKSIPRGEEKENPMAASKAEERIGEKRIVNCGMEMEIVRYGTISDIDVRFSDGTVVEHKTYRSFLKGSINPNENKEAAGNSPHIGEVVVNTDGQELHLIVYKSYANVDVQFPDGSVVHGRSYREFLAGKIRNPASFRKNEIQLSNSGLRMRVIAYRGSRKTDVEFEDGTVLCNQEYSKFDSRKLSHPHLGHKMDKLFHEVKMRVAFCQDNKTYYSCTFPDGTKDICTLQEIMERQEIKPVF